MFSFKMLLIATKTYSLRSAASIILDLLDTGILTSPITSLSFFMSCPFSSLS